MLNLNPLKTFVMLAALATVACDVQGALDDLEEQAVDAAFKTIADNAKANGGEAILVRPGKEYTLTVINPASKINGATIRVPADAIPADLEQAALAIQVAPSNAPSAEHLKVAGASAGVVFTKLPGGEAVVPLKPLSFGLPYAADTSFPVASLVLGVIGTDGKIVVPEGSKSDEAKKQVLGDSVVFNVITAVYEVDFAGGDAAANSFQYKITNADGSKSCAGWNETPTFGVKTYAYLAGAYKFSLSLSGVGNFTLETADASNPAVPTASYDVPLSGSSTLNITCATLDGTILGGDVETKTTAHLAFSDWAGTLGTATNCATTNDCAPNTGSVAVVGHFDYVTTSGDVVKAAINTTIPDFVWYTLVP